MLRYLLKRRELLQRAILSAGGVFIGAAPVKVIWAQGNKPRLFTSCKVVSVDANTVTGLNGNGLVTVTLGPNLDVWKGRHGTNVGDIRVGDVIDAVGEASDAGTFVAKEISVNIVNIYGKLLQIGSDSFLVDRYLPERTGVLFGFTVNRSIETAFMNARWQDFRPGYYVQALGLTPSTDISVTN
jgi:hypothetical protein